MLLTNAVVFYSIWQIRKYLDNWVFTFALTMTVAGAVYAFLRMATHGKYCELALDDNVRPLGLGTLMSQMDRGMHHNLRNWRGRIWRLLDDLGGYTGLACYLVIWVCIWFALASLWELGSLKWLLEELENWFVGALQYRLGVVPVILAIALSVIVLSVILLIFVIPRRVRGAGHDLRDCVICG